MTSPATPPPVECGVAAFVMPGHTKCGDLEIVHRDHRTMLVGAVDGIGHGEEAAQAAGLARRTIIAHAREPLVAIFQRCHDALRATRGVVMSLAAIDADHGLLSWIAVGNVRGILCRAESQTLGGREELLQRPGVVGASLPLLQPAVLEYKNYATVIFATDGIRGDAFSGKIAIRSSPQALAANILANHCLGIDDALVVVARLG